MLMRKLESVLRIEQDLAFVDLKMVSVVPDTDRAAELAPVVVELVGGLFSDLCWVCMRLVLYLYFLQFLGWAVGVHEVQSDRGFDFLKVTLGGRVVLICHTDVHFEEYYI